MPRSKVRTKKNCRMVAGDVPWVLRRTLEESVFSLDFATSQVRFLQTN